MRPRYTARRLADFARAVRVSRQMEKRERWPRERLDGFRQEQLVATVRHAAAHSPFYRERFAGIDLDDHLDLRSLPTLDKGRLMAAWDRVVTDPRLRLAETEAHLDALERDDYLHGRYRVMATGGTSGRRGVFVFNRAEWSVALALFLRFSGFTGIGPRLPRRRRVATIVAGSPQHMTYRYTQAMDVGLYRIETFDARTPVAELVEQLNAFQPDVVGGYPSVVSLLAIEQLEGRLRIAPEAVTTSSEVRTEEMTENIRRAWSTEPFDNYGITEAGIFAIECTAHAGLHLMEDTTIVEVVDDDRRPVRDGERGTKLLVTNLYNRTQPLIRYELSDMVAISPERCRCGRTFRLVESVEGRSDDMLELVAAGGGTVTVHPLAVRSPMAKCPEVRQYRIVHDDDGLHVEAALRDGASAQAARAAVEQRLRAGLLEAGASPPRVEVHIVDEVARGGGVAGKFKLVESRAGKRDRVRAS